jgi:hypothetical protein
MSKVLTLAAVGDVAPIRPFAPQGAHAGMWRRFGQAGLSMINLEVPLTTRQHGSYILRSASSTARVCCGCEAGPACRDRQLR